MDKPKRTLFIFFDQDALAERRKLKRGTTVINQLEFCIMVSKDVLDLGTETKRKVYAGTHKGDSVGPVASPKTDGPWSPTLQETKSCYGSYQRVQVGIVH